MYIKPPYDLWVMRRVSRGKLDVAKKDQWTKLEREIQKLHDRHFMVFRKEYRAAEREFMEHRRKMYEIHKKAKIAEVEGQKPVEVVSLPSEEPDKGEFHAVEVLDRLMGQCLGVSSDISRPVVQAGAEEADGELSVSQGDAQVVLQEPVLPEVGAGGVQE